MANPTPTHHPVVIRLNTQRYEDFQLRLADRITAFAGSMHFVYLHAMAFATWMLVFERSPWPTLTLVVSLEAIFLSTFVMIGQNRQAAFQQAKADHDFHEQEQELQTEHAADRGDPGLTTELHTRVLGDPAAADRTSQSRGAVSPADSQPLDHRSGARTP